MNTVLKIALAAALASVASAAMAQQNTAKHTSAGTTAVTNDVSVGLTGTVPTISIGSAIGISDQNTIINGVQDAKNTGNVKVKSDAVITGISGATFDIGATKGSLLNSVGISAVGAANSISVTNAGAAGSVNTVVDAPTTLTITATTSGSIVNGYQTANNSAHVSNSGSITGISSVGGQLTSVNITAVGATNSISVTNTVRK